MSLKISPHRHFKYKYFRFQFGDITIPRKFFDDLPLPTIGSIEEDNPEFSQDLRKLYRSIENMDAQNESQVSAISDLNDKMLKKNEKQTSFTRRSTIKFNVETFNPDAPSEEIRQQIKSFEARDFVEQDSKSKDPGFRRKFEKMPIFRSEYLDSFILREGKFPESVLVFVTSQFLYCF